MPRLRLLLAVPLDPLLLGLTGPSASAASRVPARAPVHADLVPGR